MSQGCWYEQVEIVEEQLKNGPCDGKVLCWASNSFGDPIRQRFEQVSDLLEVIANQYPMCCLAAPPPSSRLGRPQAATQSSLRPYLMSVS